MFLFLTSHQLLGGWIKEHEINVGLKHWVWKHLLVPLKRKSYLKNGKIWKQYLYLLWNLYKLQIKHKVVTVHWPHSYERPSAWRQGVGLRCRDMSEEEAPQQSSSTSWRTESGDGAQRRTPLCLASTQW
jgi:hypothetical protein